MGIHWSIWIGFLAFILAMLALDLGVLQRRTHAPSFRESLIWSMMWIGLALLFNAGVWHWYGSGPAMQFLSGYLIEKSLSIDNLFVFVMIFSWFAVPGEQQHRVLFWGVLGALVMRGIFIAGGVALINRFEWITWIFGAFLIYTAWKMLRSEHREFNGDSNPLVRMARRWLPLAGAEDKDHLIVRRAGRWMITPLFLVLLVIEATDVMFAVDSVPAVLAISRDPFIVFTSNVFAILGLRALYFLVAGVLDRLYYLRHGLAAILVFVGGKMLTAHFVTVPIVVSLGVIFGILGIATAASLARSSDPRAELEKTQ